MLILFAVGSAMFFHRIAEMERRSGWIWAALSLLASAFATYIIGVYILVAQLIFVLYYVGAQPDQAAPQNRLSSDNYPPGQNFPVCLGNFRCAEAGFLYDLSQPVKRRRALLRSNSPRDNWSL
jgi:hypothetical protein